MIKYCKKYEVINMKLNSWPFEPITSIEPLGGGLPPTGKPG
jgi:hypothetical protein